MPTLFLMRHGEDDREKLTERGRLQARYTAMRIMEVVPYEQDLLILSSETPRARETTQILAKMFQDEGRRVTMRAEKDDANEKIPDVLSTLNKESVVIVVGQEP